MITGNEPSQPVVQMPFNAEKGEVAFNADNADFYVNFPGLSIRQQFAMVAMQGLCASGFYTDRKLQAQAKQYDAEIDQCIAIASVSIADALIKELNK